MADDYRAAALYRLKESKWLFEKGIDEGHFEGSFYLGGYVAEFSLKFLYEAFNGPGTVPRRFGHHISTARSAVKLYLTENAPLDAFANDVVDILDISLSNGLINQWDVNHRYQGSLGILNEPDMKKFLADIDYVYRCARQMESEWRIMRGAGLV